MARELRTAERIGFFGVVVMMFGITTEINMHEYQATMGLFVALGVTAFSTRQLYLMRTRWPRRWPFLR